MFLWLPDFLGEEDGIRVWRCLIPPGVDAPQGADRWPCLKAVAVVDAPPEALADLLLDSDRAHVTNKYSAGNFGIQDMS